MAAALSLTPTTDKPRQLASRLDRWLTGCTISTIDGQVLVESHRLDQDKLIKYVQSALQVVYGQDWRQHVEGLE